LTLNCSSATDTMDIGVDYPIIKLPPPHHNDDTTDSDDDGIIVTEGISLKLTHSIVQSIQSLLTTQLKPTEQQLEIEFINEKEGFLYINSNEGTMKFKLRLAASVDDDIFEVYELHADNTNGRVDVEVGEALHFVSTLSSRFLAEADLKSASS
jgi:hypothetical protein